MRPEPQSVVEAYILSRLDGVLALGFQPAMSFEQAAKRDQEYVGALNDLPVWALAAAFDKWVRDHSAKHPTPGGIRTIAVLEMQEIGREIGRRRQAADMAEADRRERCDPDTAAAILIKAGFTPKRFEAVKERRMATSRDELWREPARPEPHWTETVSPEDHRMIELRKARDANPLIRDSRATTAGQAEADCQD